MRNETTTQRLLILGLDGADLRLIVPWAKQGRLPAFAQLLHQGAWGGLRSTIPPMTAPAWSSFMSGLSPENHGILDFHARIPFAYERQQPLYDSHNLPRSFWEVTGDYGNNVIVMGVPLTFPPRPVNGVLISGLLTPASSQNFIYPSEFRAQLLQKFPSFRISATWEQFGVGKEKDVHDEIMSVLQTQLDACTYLLSTQPWKLAIAVFSAPDQMQHFFWKFMDLRHPHYEQYPALTNAIYYVYKSIDSFINNFNALFPETTLMIVSDHGVAPFIKQFHLNAWLHETGFLSYTNPILAGDIPVDRKPIFDFIKQFHEAEVQSTVPGQFGIGQGVISIGLQERKAVLAHPDTRISYRIPVSGQLQLRVTPAIDGAYWDPRCGDGVVFAIELETDNNCIEIYRGFIDPKQNAGDRGWNELLLPIGDIKADRTRIHFKTLLGPRRLFDWTQSGWVEPRLEYMSALPSLIERQVGIDMHRTVAYAGSETELGIFLNKHPLPFATISDNNHERNIIREISERLKTISDNGFTLFSKLITKIERDPAPFLHRAPDIVLIPNRFRCIPDDRVTTTLYGDTSWRSGTHSQHGILIVYGPNIRKQRIRGARIIDIAPTVLRWLSGIELKCDGKFLEGLLDYELPPAHSQIYAQAGVKERESNDIFEEMQRRQQLTGLGYL